MNAERQAANRLGGIECSVALYRMTKSLDTSVETAGKSARATEVHQFVAACVMLE